MSGESLNEKAIPIYTEKGVKLVDSTNWQPVTVMVPPGTIIDRIQVFAPEVSLHAMVDSRIMEGELSSVVLTEKQIAEMPLETAWVFFLRATCIMHPYLRNIVSTVRGVMRLVLVYGQPALKQAEEVLLNPRSVMRWQNFGVSGCLKDRKKDIQYPDMVLPMYFDDTYMDTLPASPMLIADVLAISRKDLLDQLRFCFEVRQFPLKQKILSQLHCSDELKQKLSNYDVARVKDIVVVNYPGSSANILWKDKKTLSLLKLSGHNGYEGITFVDGEDLESDNPETVYDLQCIFGTTEAAALLKVDYCQCNCQDHNHHSFSGCFSGEDLCIGWTCRHKICIKCYNLQNPDQNSMLVCPVNDCPKGKTVQQFIRVSKLAIQTQAVVTAPVTKKATRSVKKRKISRKKNATKKKKRSPTVKKEKLEAAELQLEFPGPPNTFIENGYYCKEI